MVLLKGHVIRFQMLLSREVLRQEILYLKWSVNNLPRLGLPLHH